MNQEVRLTADEKEAVHIFLSKKSIEIKRRENYLLLRPSSSKRKLSRKKIAKVSKYRSTAHVTPVSSNCEHTNSISKHIMSDCQKQMEQSSL